MSTALPAVFAFAVLAYEEAARRAAQRTSEGAAVHKRGSLGRLSRLRLHHVYAICATNR